VFEGRKAKKLGIKDFGEASRLYHRKSDRLIQVYLQAHHYCGFKLRMGKTKDGNLVRWCPKCEFLIYYPTNTSPDISKA